MSQLFKIEQFWYSKSLLRRFLLPLSLLIQAVAIFKRFLYQSHILKTNKFKVPVIVVGNITMGGTGKTPFINYLVRQLHSKGIKVGIVSRGYRSIAPQYPHIVRANDSPQTIGDEAFMQYASLKVPMAIGSNRTAAVTALSQEYSLDVIISDDGLQHYAMARQLEILMVDAKRQFGNQLMLPFGPLREPLSRINTVDFIIQNGSSVASTATNQVPVATMSIVTTGLIHLCSNKMVSLCNFKQNTICAVAGIGNPERFFASLSNHCTEFERKIFPDHHDFQMSDFDTIKSDMIVMTEKDAVKCSHFAKSNWYFLKIDAILYDSDFENLYELMDNKIFNKV